MATRLGIPPAHVVGCLAVVWAWARDEMDEAGTVGVPPEYIDSLAGVVGFADAMRDRGWLDTTAESVRFPSPDRWITRDAMTRARARERADKSRARKAHAPTQSACAKSAPDRDRDKEREGEEEENDSFVVVLRDDDEAEPELSPDLRGMVSKRLALLSGISPSHVPSTLVTELVAYTAGRPAKKHDAATWPNEAPQPLDRARMLSEAFDVAEANATTKTLYGVGGYVLTVMETAISAGEYPSQKQAPKRKPRRKGDDWREALDDAMDWTKETA